MGDVVIVVVGVGVLVVVMAAMRLSEVVLDDLIAKGDARDLDHIAHPERDWWPLVVAQPGVPSLADGACSSCIDGLHGGCSGRCCCDCPWPNWSRDRATMDL